MVSPVMQGTTCEILVGDTTAELHLCNTQPIAFTFSYLSNSVVFKNSVDIRKSL
jgi:hypothetical protein